MRILVIDNKMDRDSWGSEDLCRYIRMIPNTTIIVRRAPGEDLPKNPEAFDRIIVSGSKTSALEDSPWISQLFEFIKKSVDLKKPFLGVCYGHQALVRTLSGKDFLQRSESPEFGWIRVEVSHPSPLFAGLPSSFYSFASHFEEVSQLPTGMKQLASSDTCAIQACQLADAPVFGLQFHPEKTAAEGDQILSEKQKLGVPQELINLNQSKKLYNPKVAETIFRNFLTL